MTYPFYIFLGLIPSLIWLSFYLRKDVHPEPKTMIIKVFIWGMLISPIAFVLEFLLQWLFHPYMNLQEIISSLNQIPTSLLGIIINAAFIPAIVEEILKYQVVKKKVLNNPQFDEPIDAMVYCIVVALGFAAVENILSVILVNNWQETLLTLGARFVGATFLHVLATGILGYYIALSIFYTKHRKKFLLFGLTIAISFHMTFNYLVSMLYNGKIFVVIITACLMIFASLMLSWFFESLKQLKSICKISAKL